MKKEIADMAKDVYISFRTSNEIREVLKKLAEEGYRTLSQQCEMAIIEWLKSQGIDWKEPSKK